MLVMVLPALLVFWVRRSVPESPLFLIRKGRRDEAAKVIDDLVAATGAEPRVYSLPEAQDAPRLSAGSAWTQLRLLWQYDWKITTAAWSLFFSILLVYYLSLTWMPRILIGAGFEEYKAFLTTASMAAVGLLGVVVAALLVERVGRKWILAITGPLSALTLVIVAIVVDIPTAAVFWLLVFGFVVQVAIPVLYAYVSELYPTELRGSGFGWASTFSRLGAGFGPLVFAAFLWPELGLATSFALAGVPGAAVRAVDGVLRPRNQAAPPRLSAPAHPGCAITFGASEPPRGTKSDSARGVVRRGARSAGVCGGEGCQRGDQEPALHHLDPFVQGFLGLAVPDRHGFLRDDRARVHPGVGPVHRAAGDLHAVGQRVADAVRAGERGQQGRVRVEVFAAERVDEVRADDPHEP